MIIQRTAVHRLDGGMRAAVLVALMCAQEAAGFSSMPQHTVTRQDVYPLQHGPACGTSRRRIHVRLPNMRARHQPVVPPDVQAACARVAVGLFQGQEPTWQDVVQASAAHRAQHGQPSGEHLLFDGPLETRGFGARQAAIKGDARAMHTLGLLYFGGYGGLPQSNVCSARWHAAAAAAGNWDAVAVLGGCLRKGAGVERDESLGLKLIGLSSGVDNVQGLIKQGIYALCESTSA